MVLGAFSMCGKSDLVFVEGYVNSAKYVKILQKHLIPWMGKTHPKSAIFQQENDHAHTAKETQAWMARVSLEVMDWPSKSPYMNPIENIWALMAKRVYKNGRQFDKLSDLRDALRMEWENSTLDEMKNMATSMPCRRLDLVEGNSGPTRY